MHSDIIRQLDSCPLGALGLQYTVVCILIGLTVLPYLNDRLPVWFRHGIKVTKRAMEQSHRMAIAIKHFFAPPPPPPPPSKFPRELLEKASRHRNRRRRLEMLEKIKWALSPKFRDTSGTIRPVRPTDTARRQMRAAATQTTRQTRTCGVQVNLETAAPMVVTVSTTAEEYAPAAIDQPTSVVVEAPISKATQEPEGPRELEGDGTQSEPASAGGGLIGGDVEEPDDSRESEGEDSCAEPTIAWEEPIGGAFQEPEHPQGWEGDEPLSEPAFAGEESIGCAAQEPDDSRESEGDGLPSCPMRVGEEPVSYAVQEPEDPQGLEGDDLQPEPAFAGEELTGSAAQEPDDSRESEGDGMPSDPACASVEAVTGGAIQEPEDPAGLEGDDLLQPIPNLSTEEVAPLVAAEEPEVPAGSEGEGFASTAVGDMEAQPFDTIVAAAAQPSYDEDVSMEDGPDKDLDAFDYEYDVAMGEVDMYDQPIEDTDGDVEMDGSDEPVPAEDVDMGDSPQPEPMPQAPYHEPLPPSADLLHFAATSNMSEDWAPIERPMVQIESMDELMAMGDNVPGDYEPAMVHATIEDILELSDDSDLTDYESEEEEPDTAGDRERVQQMDDPEPETVCGSIEQGLELQEGEAVEANGPPFSPLTDEDPDVQLARLQAARFEAEMEAEDRELHEAQHGQRHDAELLEAEQEVKLRAQYEAQRQVQQQEDRQNKLRAQQEAQHQAQLEAERREAEREMELSAQEEARRQAQIEAQQAELEAQLMAQHQAEAQRQAEAQLLAERQAEMRAQREAQRQAQRQAQHEADERQRDLEADLEAALEAKERAPAQTSSSYAIGTVEPTYAKTTRSDQWEEPSSTENTPKQLEHPERRQILIPRPQRRPQNVPVHMPTSWYTGQSQEETQAREERERMHRRIYSVAQDPEDAPRFAEGHEISGPTATGGFVTQMGEEEDIYSDDRTPEQRLRDEQQQQRQREEQEQGASATQSVAPVLMPGGLMMPGAKVIVSTPASASATPQNPAQPPTSSPATTGRLPPRRSPLFMPRQTPKSTVPARSSPLAGPPLTRGRLNIMPMNTGQAIIQRQEEARRKAEEEQEAVRDPPRHHRQR